MLYSLGVVTFVVLHNLYLLKLGFHEDFLGKAAGLATVGTLAGSLPASCAGAARRASHSAPGCDGRRFGRGIRACVEPIRSVAACGSVRVRGVPLHLGGLLFAGNRCTQL